MFFMLNLSQALVGLNINLFMYVLTRALKLRLQDIRIAIK